MLADEAHDLLVGLAQQARGRFAVARRVPVEVRAVGARLLHGGAGRQPAGPLARRPVALVAGVTGGQAACASSRAARHEPRRIGGVAA